MALANLLPRLSFSILGGRGKREPGDEARYLHNVVYKSLTTKVGQLVSIDLKSWFTVEKVNEGIKLCWTNFNLLFHSIQQTSTFVIVTDT